MHHLPLHLPLLLALAAWLAFLARRLRYDLHMAQLNGYFTGRYLRWLRGNLAAALPPLEWLPWLGVGAAALVPMGELGWGGLYLLAFFLRRPKPQKKPLAMTARATRLYAAALALAALLAAAAAGSGGGIGWLAGLTAAALAAPLLIAAANLLLQPVERGVQRWYLNDARRRIRAVDGLTVIGITGSYGKTSTKFILGGILERHFTTLVTPESYNTPMGVTRTARERLKPIHQLFVVEMGAKRRGDIHELCELAGPRVGVVTAIGEQHLETFGSLETIRRTKAELIEAVPADGFVVLNGDDPNVRQVAGLARGRVVWYGLANTAADYRAEAVTVTADGTRFTVRAPGGVVQSFETRLLGTHNVGNILAGIAVAAELGVPLAEVAHSVKGLRPVPHRLQLIKGADGVTIIDDAFNANPVGALAALDVLAAMPGGPKILITPGMIELGGQQEARNRELGERAAGCCDRVILVGPRQTRPIRAGLEARGFPAERLYLARDLDDARRHLATLLRPGAVALFENDLPDTFAE